ncbi:uncharacterized protein LOC116848234 [Odontomachus brunneus]|uniref:uncharacterized protein LOC116848234 n=1 Tax=Odontomachus brunneus TaxID=486640 RepID=UPI0013F2541F|nr:uncharacterized protein LOC116848234 [Odontomachus brunneus]
MWLSRSWLLLVLLGLVCARKPDEDDAASVFIEEAKNLFSQKSIENPQVKQVGDMLLEKRTSTDSVNQIISGLGSFMAGGQNNQGFDMSMVGSILNVLSTMNNDGQASHAKRLANDVEDRKQEHGIDWASVINMGSALFQQSANTDMVMGLVPMVLEALGHGTDDHEGGSKDHSGHSWFLPPILENIHVMWDHFSNSELGQTLWKNSGLMKVIAHVSDQHGNIHYEKILESFEDPAIRRRWIRSLTNFVAEWLSHVTDPVNQQRYLSTMQFVGNSFLKSQGFPKSVMFDAQRPTESLIRLANMLARRYLGMNINSALYVKPAISYFQELASLASEKGFIMSRINARELSNKLSDTINNDIIFPMLKAFRAYKWASKVPHCASQILCTINEQSEQDDSRDKNLKIRGILLKVASFPAAWAVSNNLGINFWSLYGAIMEHEGCIRKYPANCTAFHEEEIRVTTESIHNEL